MGKYVSKTVDEFESWILSMIARSLGVEVSTLGPNLRGLVKFEAQELYAQQSLFEETMRKMLPDKLKCDHNFEMPVAFWDPELGPAPMVKCCTKCGKQDGT
jgi:hypothetical protein